MSGQPGRGAARPGTWSGAMSDNVRDRLARDPGAQRALAGQIADRTLGVRGFFEWESDPEDV